MLIYVHKSAIVGVKCLNLTIQENTKTNYVNINNKQIVQPAILIFVHKGIICR